MPRVWRVHGVRWAASVCLASCMVAVASLWQALRLGDERGPEAAPAEDPALRDTPRAPGYSLERVLAAVAKDPFHPERRRPGARFRLPGDRAFGVHRQPAASPAGVRVIGTAAAPDGAGFAMCALMGGTPRIVRVGERVGDWTLKRVTPGAAEFATAGGGTIVVRIAKGGA
jgi:hypothetical protein